MARIKSHFKCIDCDQILNFPKDVSIMDFTILMLQFYKIHDLCENLKKSEPTDQLETPRPDGQ